MAPSFIKADPDKDGLFNDQEKELGTDPLKSDTDNDGVGDGNEVEIGTSPVDFDTDGDGLGDGEEIDLETDPNDLDSDDDGLSDGYEVKSFNTNPLNADTDGDQLSDKNEEKYNTNPLVSDTDDDGTTDYDEIFVRGTNPLVQDVSVMLTLKDSETNLPVIGVPVYIDGEKAGETTQQGTIHIAPLSFGEHLLTITAPAYKDLDVGYITVQKGTDRLTCYADMPNPKLIVSATPKELLRGFNEVGTVTIEVSNFGEVPSEDTMVLITVYDAEDEKTLSQDLMRIGSIAVGEKSDPRESDILDTSYWHDEYILVVVFERNRYFPESDLRTMIDAPGSIVDDLVNAVKDYLFEHPEVLGKIADVFLTFLPGS